ncbi:MAG TPA: hypothetical protein VFK52_01990 [Nocardioidaceae bacterium]|nr:hypothetical protein [Nocardioidaceae bacterium]
MRFRRGPRSSDDWYDIGLAAKWKRDWPTSYDANLRALELLDDTREAAAAWNLGIAATALGEWATARRAWTAYGITLPEGDGDAPILGDFGVTPVRLNPEPRFDEPELTVDGVRHRTEVVWATRLCPARARIENVPTPETGHRYGDVVLHDGDSVGERQYGGGTRPVFNEIALLERSPFSTLEVELPPLPHSDLDALSTLFQDHGLMAEEWSTGIVMLCRACSEGTPSSEHDHGPDDAPDLLRFGLGARPADAEALLDEWSRGGTGRAHGPVQLLLA